MPVYRYGNHGLRHRRRGFPRLDLGRLLRNRQVVMIPSSTANTIVFPFNFSTCQFAKHDYSPMMTNDKLGTEELSQFLGEIESQLLGWDANSGFHLVKYLVLIFILVVIATAIAIPVGAITKSSSSKKSSSFPIVVPIMMAILVGYVIFFILMIIMIKIRSNRKLQEVTENVRNYINQRAASFKSRGLEWLVPLKFPYWIELYKQDAVQQFDATNQQFQLQTVEMSSYNMPNNMGYKIHPEAVMPNHMPLQQQENLGFYSQNMYAGNTYNNVGVYP